MTLAFVSADAVEQYPVGGVDIRRRFPNTSFPKDIESADLSAFGVATVYSTDQPAIDENTQRIEEGAPAFANGIWKQVWNVTSLTTEELASIAELKLPTFEANVTTSWPLLTGLSLQTTL